MSTSSTYGDKPVPTYEPLFLSGTDISSATPVSIAATTPAVTATPTFTPTPLPTPIPEPRSMATGTIIVNSAGGNGRGELAVTNRLGYDTAFIIAKNTSPKVPMFGVYIGKYSSYTIAGIPDGTYILYYTYGRDWDGDQKKFTQPIAYLRFAENMNYSTKTTDEYIYYTTYTVALNPLAGGNATVTDVGASGFPDL